MYDTANITRELYFGTMRIMVRVWHDGKLSGFGWFDNIDSARTWAKEVAVNVNDHTAAE